MIISSFNEKDDFVVFFEFHDDILIMDSSLNPKKINFYQVKTKKKWNWTISELLKVDKESSILWKLYQNKINFWLYADKLFFVTNTTISTKDVEENKVVFIDPKEYSFSTLAPSEISKIDSSLWLELGTDYKSDLNTCGIFKITELSLSDTQRHCIGALAQLINDSNPGNTANPTVAYKTIYDYINRKSIYTFSEEDLKWLTESDFQNLVKLKWVSRQDFQKILESIWVWRDPEKVWESIERALNGNFLNPVEIMKFRKWWEEYRSKLAIHSIFDDIWRDVKKIIDIPNLIPEESSLKEMLDIIYWEIHKLYPEYIDTESSIIIKSLILHQIYD